MRIEPVAADKGDPYKDLPKMDRVMRRVAIFTVFVGVFKWAMDVVFG